MTLLTLVVYSAIAVKNCKFLLPRSQSCIDQAWEKHRAVIIAP